jgi:uncharacterized protein (DUF2235 family)
MDLKRTLASACLLLLHAAAATAQSPSAASPAASDPAKPIRRLVICIDGTLNNPEQYVDTTLVKGHQLYKPTNVLKTFRTVLPVAPDGTTQIAYYSEGIGSFIGEKTRSGRLATIVNNLLGGAGGTGFEGGVKAAYRFLVANYQPGDEVFIFGFSRGAAQARTLVRFIGWVGGVLHKDDEYFIVELYDNFSQHHGSRPAKAVLEEIRERGKNRPPADEAETACIKKKTCPSTPAQEACCSSAKADKPQLHWACKWQECPHLPQIEDPLRLDKIKFLGVYDTVFALGSRFGKTPSAPEYAYLVDPDPPANVQTARQALAIDERRWDFSPQVWRCSAQDPAHPCPPDMVQRWFPGVHSDVGGGYCSDGLANAALQWMLGEAREAGLAFDCCHLQHYGPWICGNRPETDTGLTKFGELIRCKSGRGVRDLAVTGESSGTTRMVDDSVAWLLVDDPTYRPQNLLSYLAQDESRIVREFPQLPAAQLAKLREIVAGWKEKAPRH